MSRLNVNINDETSDALLDLAVRRNSSVTDIVGRAVEVYRVIEEATAAGKTVRLVGEDEIVELHLL
jgi:hypothetical protein